MEDYYTDRDGYLAQIKILEDTLDELEKYDAWNDDTINEEIWKVKRAINLMKEKIEPDPSYPCYEDAN